MKLIDLIGRTFGHLLVKSSAEANGRGLVQWTCLCSCGAEIVALGDKLRSGRKTSCGCMTVRRGGHPIVHGHSIKGRESATYRAWHSMITRCHCPTVSNYDRYGGRGILVCDRWRTFENFLADMGEAPTDKRSPDRIDNEKGYEPGNVRWASAADQARNRRNNKLTTAGAAAIRASVAAGDSQTVVAAAHNISRRMVNAIIAGKRWA